MYFFVNERLLCAVACVHAYVCSVVSDPAASMDCSLPGSSVHGILQARILEWVAILLQGISPSQELNLCPLYWQVDSLPLSHLGIP